MDSQEKFYLGRMVDAETGQETAQPLLYDPGDLTTHAVVVGMTGSGKTGLCIDLLEEAALQGVPALMIDPKGDITNLLLQFPDLAGQDFMPWVNADEARRAGQTLEQAGAAAAALWKAGLEKYGIPPERMRALQNAAHYTVYTPGSDAGQPVSILASLKAPLIPWEGNRDLLREKIASTVTALLGLVGFRDIDPVRSREHILLANIFEQAWSQGQDLELAELILQTQAPPFAKLGVFDVNTFFPEKERFELAMALNNILASPAFQVWIEGQPLDVAAMLYGEDGRPRHSVFYIAHLGDVERMFFVTLLYSAVESWMRAQPGTTSLRALLYFDEIYGFLPPVHNPPSKQPMLRMLKQARAFGVGQVLVTQNPVDLDYKALSNAGTWFVGKLQTEQDKQRLLDGLQGAMSGSLDRSAYDRLISRLGKREFLLHNVHASKPQLFKTRWAMSYLAGPLTRAQIPALVALHSPSGLAAQEFEQPAAPIEASEPAAELSDFQPIPIGQPDSSESGSWPQTGSATRPALPAGVREYVLPNTLTLTQAFKAARKSFPSQALQEGLVYRPVILGQARLRFLNRKYNLDYELKRAVIILDPDRRGMAHWEQHLVEPLDEQMLDMVPDPRARFAVLDAPFSDGKTLKAMERGFLDWAYSASQVSVRANPALKLYAGPEVSTAEFRTLSADAARQAQKAELDKTEAAYARKIDAEQTKLSREERELSEDQSEYSHRRIEEMGTHAENVFGLFGGRRNQRRLSSSLTKRRLTEQAKEDVEESLDAIQELKRKITALEQEKAEALQSIRDRWAETAMQIEEISVMPYKKDVLLEMFGVAWMPYHRVRVGELVEELPGYGS